jgi:hypothetical protein
LIWKVLIFPILSQSAWSQFDSIAQSLVHIFRPLPGYASLSNTFA